MSSRFALGTALLALGSLTGCFKSIDTTIKGFDDYAAELCRVAFDCGCMGQTPYWPDVETCATEFARVVNEAQLRAIGARAKRDEECATKRIESASATNCQAFTRLDGTAALETCQLYSGDLVEGEECISYDGAGRMSNCEQGLTCRGRCMDPVLPLFLNAEGEDCADASGRPVGLCDEDAGLVCDFFGSGRCVSAVELGQSCSPGVPNGCAGDAFCGEPGGGGPPPMTGTDSGGGNDTNTFTGGGGSDGGGGPLQCRPRRNSGASCDEDNECTTLRCNNGRCAMIMTPAVCHLGAHF